MRVLAALLIASIVAPARLDGPCWETVLAAPADRSDGTRWKDALP
jgi:hypothetical protein